MNSPRVASATPMRTISFGPGVARSVKAVARRSGSGTVSAATMRGAPSPTSNNATSSPIDARSRHHADKLHGSGLARGFFMIAVRVTAHRCGRVVVARPAGPCGPMRGVRLDDHGRPRGSPLPGGVEGRELLAFLVVVQFGQQRRGRRVETHPVFGTDGVRLWQRRQGFAGILVDAVHEELVVQVGTGRPTPWHRRSR